ncbi:MAG: hypothetical protein J6X53_06515 [Abditibacteriota bacterium]|nr:hypothetical protein [Abditibacteriota bacterium]
MAEITLQLTDARMEALEQALEEEGLGSVEGFMQDYLIDLFSEKVPYEVQIQIQKQLDAERQRRRKDYGDSGEKTEPSALSNQEEIPGKYTGGSRPLRAEDIGFRDDVLRYDSRLNFKLDPDIPTLYEALGVHDDIEKPGGLYNAYVNFDLETGKPSDHLELAVCSQDGGEDTLLYRLSAGEQAILLPKMDEYLQRRHGRSLEESVQKYAADRGIDQERKSGSSRKKTGKKKRPER